MSFLLILLGHFCSIHQACLKHISKNSTRPANRDWQVLIMKSAQVFIRTLHQFLWFYIWVLPISDCSSHLFLSSKWYRKPLNFTDTSLNSSVVYSVPMDPVFTYLRYISRLNLIALTPIMSFASYLFWVMLWIVSAHPQS